MANDKFIEDIAGKLRDHASDVNPQMWQGISSQLGAGAGAAATGGLGFAKIAGIVGIAVTSVAITYFAVSSNQEEKPNENVATVSTKVDDTQEIKEESKGTDAKEVVKQELTNSKEPLKAVAPKEVITLITQENETQENSIEEKTIKTPLAPESILPNKKSVEPIVEKTTAIQKTVVKETAIENKEEEVTQPVETPVQTEKVVTARFITLPNIFTPNNDGVNDEFFVQSSGMFNYQLVVLDVNNKVVWSSNDPNAKWDGRNLGGDKLPNGTYIYFITAEDEAGNPIQEHKRLEIK